MYISYIHVHMYVGTGTGNWRRVCLLTQALKFTIPCSFVMYTIVKPHTDVQDVHFQTSAVI